MSSQLAAVLVPCAVIVLFSHEPAGAEHEERTYDIRFLTHQPSGSGMPLAWRQAGALTLEQIDRGVHDPLAAGEAGIPGDGAWPASLIELLVRRNVAPAFWSDDRNRILVRDGALVVRQAPPVHEEIEAMLRRMRFDRARMLAVDLAFLPVDALRGADPALPLDEAQLAGALEAAGADGAFVSTCAFDGQRVLMPAAGRRDSALDTAINGTGLLPVSTVELTSLPIGWTVDCVPRALPQSDVFRLELTAIRLAEAGEARLRKTPLADLETIQIEEESLATILFLAPGRSVVAGVFDDARGEARRRFAVLARVRPLVLDSGDAAEQRPIRAHPASGAAAFDLAFLLRLSRGRHGVLDAGAVERLVRYETGERAGVDPEREVFVEDGRFLVVHGSEASRKAARDWIAAQVRAHARTARVSVREYEGPRDAVMRLAGASQDGLYLEEGWEEHAGASAIVETFRAAVAGAPRARLRAQAISSRSFVRDVQCASGGTGYAVIELPDPELAFAGTGFFLDASIRPLRDPGRVLLELELLRTATTFQRRVRFQAGTERVETVTADRTADASGEHPPAGEPFLIDLPAQRAAACELSVELEVGRSAVLEIRTEGDRARMTVARVELAAVPASTDRR